MADALNGAEKGVVAIDNRTLELPSSSPPSDTALTPAQQKRVLRKIDLRLLPILGVMYSISVIDRTNIGLALVAGMQEQLGLAIGDRYTILVLIFNVSYILFEIPSNLALPRVGCANWLTFLGVSFGAIMLGMGFVRDWGSMAVCRVLLGVFEAGFLPGCAYLITCWYTRYEVGKRLAFFWILSVLSGGFSAIFAYVLSLLGGRAGLLGWSWIFIIEGAITIVVCLAGWFLIVDFPAKSESFLAPDEKRFVIDRINRDRGDAEEDALTLAKVLFHLRDWKLYFWAINLCACTLPGYAYQYFLPIILRNGMGYSSTDSQLLSAPPYILAAVICCVSGWLSDRYHIRGPVVAVHQLLTAAGMLITVFGRSNGARYFGAFLGIGFLQYCVPGVLTFQANNITSHSKRAVASAVCMMGGGVGGIIAGVAFKNSESPNYSTGVFTALAVSLLSVALIGVMEVHFVRCNKLARAGQRKNEGLDDWFYTY